jgi:predicted amidohydrolase YtcJ
MWFAIQRLNSQGEEVSPAERISREQALRMYTAGAAYLQFAEDQRGSIEVGKLADLVVIDRDFLSCPLEELKAIRVEMTIIQGSIVFPR